MNVGRLAWGFLLIVAAVLAANFGYGWLTGSGTNWSVAIAVILASFAGSLWGDWSRARKARRG